jgi:hypothetical protein
VTSSLPRKCSTAELCGPNPNLERVMGIEPTLSAWKAEVLPLNYTRLRSVELRRAYPPLYFVIYSNHAYLTNTAPSWRASRSPQGKDWWRGKDSNLRRLSRQIYSLLPLAAREPLQKLSRAFCGTYLSMSRMDFSCSTGPCSRFLI